MPNYIGRSFDSLFCQFLQPTFSGQINAALLHTKAEFRSMDEFWKRTPK